MRRPASALFGRRSSPAALLPDGDPPGGGRPWSLLHHNSPVTAQLGHKSVSTAMAASLPDWMLLERFVFYRDIAAFPDSEAAPFRADGISSHDGGFSVALRIRNPPDISRLYLQWPTGPKGGSPCVLVAAHRNLLLFRLTPEPLTLSKAPFVDFRQDHFICEAPWLQSSQTRPLLLQKIPRCDLPELVTVTNGKKVTMPRLFNLNPISILCHGQEDFALAQLNFRSSSQTKWAWGKLEAELCVLRSKVTSPRLKWKIEKHLPIQYEAHERFDLDNWRTDRIIAFNKHLCWVNYGGGGILFCDLFQQRPPIFYLRLPILNRCFHQRPQAFHETNRSVSVTRGSMGCEELRFVDIVRKDCKLIGPLGSGDMEGFSITCHALRVMDSGAMEWDMLFFITCYELWNANPSLPHAALKHPVVSMSDPNVVHFLMSEHLPQIIDRVSTVSVDMSTKKVLSTNAYINGKEDLKGQDADMVRQNAHYLQTFLPSELPKFLKDIQDQENSPLVEKSCIPTSNEVCEEQPASSNAYEEQPASSNAYEEQPASSNAYEEQPASSNAYEVCEEHRLASIDGEEHRPASSDGEEHRPAMARSIVRHPVMARSIVWQRHRGTAGVGDVNEGQPASDDASEEEQPAYEVIVI